MVICPSCEGTNTSPWGRRDGHQIYECKTCELVFFDRNAIVARNYDNYHDYTDRWSAQDFSNELSDRRSRVHQQLKDLARYAPGKKILDIGAGPGYFCKLANDEGWQARGVEVAEPSARVGREVFGVTYTDLDSVKPGEVDVVTCHHVIEHLAQPRELLAKVYDRLRPGGVLVIHVPNLEPLSFLARNRLRGATGGSDERLCALYMPDHLNGFTERSLPRLVGRAGFTTLDVRTTGKWSSYSDPFFLRHYMKNRRFAQLVKHGARHAVDTLGSLFGRGDWLVGYFARKDSAAVS